MFISYLDPDKVVIIDVAWHMNEQGIRRSSLVWTINLFVFLIPVLFPKTFKKHYEMAIMKSENRAKDARD